MLGYLLLEDDMEVKRILNKMSGETSVFCHLVEVMQAWLKKGPHTWKDLLIRLQGEHCYNAFKKFTEDWLKEKSISKLKLIQAMVWREAVVLYNSGHGLERGSSDI